MTTLHPTPSRRGIKGIPFWVVVVAAALVAVLLIGVGLLLTNGKDKAPVATPTCTPSPPAASATRPPTKQVDLHVYNATERQGLAADTAASLDARGFLVAEPVANDPKKAKIPGPAVVRYVKGSGTQARWVAAQVPGATIAVVSGKDRASAVKVDLVLGDGYTSLASEADARKAFAASAPRRGC